MWKKALAVLIGLALAGGVIYLGFRAPGSSAFVVWFGLASALAAPLSISLLSYAFKADDREVLHRLSKIPEIQKLVEAANTQEEKIRLLDEERAKLADIVQLEVKRQTLTARQTSLEQEGLEVLAALRAVDEELAALGHQVQESPARDEIEKLAERLRARVRGDILITFGSKQYALDPEFLGGGLYGDMFRALFKLMASISSKHKSAALSEAARRSEEKKP